MDNEPDTEEIMSTMTRVSMSVENMMNTFGGMTITRVSTPKEVLDGLDDLIDALAITLKSVVEAKELLVRAGFYQ